MSASTGTRLMVVAVVSLVALLPVAGWMIANSFERSVQTSFDSRMQAYADMLAGRMHVAAGELSLARLDGEMRFEQVFSGWYWQVRRDGAVVETSRSLWDSSLEYPAPPDDATPARTLELSGPRGEPLRGIVMTLQFAGLASPVEVIVTGPASEIDNEVRAFRRVLLLSLGTLGLMLVTIFALQIRWGLAPLWRMERSLRKVRAGSAARVDADLPSDLRQVADVMNAVLARQESLMERARSTAGNLAHALKTPLASMRLQLERPQIDSALMRRELRQVNGIVDHHLTRAAAAGRAGGIAHRSRLRAALAPLVDAVHAMHRDRGIRLEMPADIRGEIAVDAQDLQELIGNLLDNAMKWARSEVTLQFVHTPDAVLLSVDDDGPGIPEAQRRSAMQRGMQLDEHSQGSGLGLAIVRDIAALYGIEFQLGESAAGGLSARLRLPRSPQDA
ncbi:MAG TPA: HAMP domain-containing sensor histidine kinase [Fontimonas sp.]